MTTSTLTASLALLFLLGVSADCTVAAEIVIHSQNDFAAGNQVFPAGSYRIQNYVTNRVLIRNVQTGRGTILPVVAQIGNRDDFSGVVFSFNGGRYFLSEVCLPGMGGLKLASAPQERNSEKWTVLGK